MFFLSSYKNSLSVPLFAKFLGSPFLFSHLQCSLWVTSWLTLQYLATSARKNLCVPATITQAERVFSWMEWLLKKEGFVCQENLSTCNYSWRTVMGFRLLLSLPCVFDNKLTPFISENWFSRFGFIFRTSESIICREWYEYIYYVAKQSMINRLSNPINRNRSAAKISKVMSSNKHRHEVLPGWQKLRGSTGGTRRKVWTRTKILSPNIRYFVAN